MSLVVYRMTLLITVFLVLVNIFNTITTNIPKAEGLTAIEAWVIVCVLFVFGALVGEVLGYARIQTTYHSRFTYKTSHHKTTLYRMTCYDPVT
jgi:hypothetical protein